MHGFYEAPITKYSQLGVTNEQRVFFFIISDFEIANGIILYSMGCLVMSS